MATNPTIEAGPLRLVSLPEVGGRIGSLSYDGVELLVDETVHPSNWGATYWTSPQADWGWPPVVAVDSAPYQVVEDGHAIVLRSGQAEVGPRLFRITKTFRPGPAPGIIDAVYRIDNAGNSPFRMASWEISRVGPGGLTFYRTGTQELTPIPPHGAVATTKVEGATWFDHRRFSTGESQKLHADAAAGYLAHVTQGLLVLKLFVEHPAADQAPGEGEVELFANHDGKYVEIEVQGPYESIRPGEPRDTVVRTLVRPLAELGLGEADVAVGNQRLLAAVHALFSEYAVTES